jgi:uncharacterized protein (DUF433 family)
MQLEDYFDFLAPDDIRIKGHRIGIEHVLYEYIHRRQTAEEIAQRFDTLTLEQVYATILYYLHNKEAVSKYVADWLEYCWQSRQESLRQHPEFYEKLRRLREEWKVSQQHQDSQNVPEPDHVCSAPVLPRPTLTRGDRSL